MSWCVGLIFDRKVLWLVLRVSVVLFVLAGVGVLSGAPAEAARGHVPASPITPAGAHALNEPAGVAVDEATGDVYVVDKGNDRVEYFNEQGVFQGEFTGPSAQGTGTLTEGSSTIEEAAATTGAFTVGEEISGEGIPAGTTITGIPAAGILETSNPVEEHKSGILVPLKAHQPFAGPEGIAIDNSCVLRKLAEPKCRTEDPSDGDVYVVDAGHEAVDKFSATGAYIGQLAGLGEIEGVGVDPHGELWVGTHSGTVDRFSDEEANVETASVVAHLPGEYNALGFAVDAEDDLYLRSEAGVIFKVGPNGCGGTGICEKGAEELLNRAFDPEGSEWFSVELASGDVYVDDGGALVRRGAGGSVLESLALVGGDGSGVGVSSREEELYVAQRAGDDVEVFVKEPPGPPTVESEGAARVTGDSAALEAEVNPRSVPGEAGTEYYFQYGPCATPSTCSSSAFAESAAGGSLPADFDVDTVTPVEVQELSAGTTYHYRVVAVNDANHTANVVDGAERTFTTQTVGSFVLPDDREWELVSPADKHGAIIEAPGVFGSIQAAADGGAMTFGVDLPTESAPQGYTGVAQVLSVRGADGWVSRDLTIAHEAATRTSVGGGSEFRVFSADLSHALVQPQGSFVACRSPEGAAQPCLSAQATEQTPFLATTFAGGNPAQACVQPSGPGLEAGAASCFQPLVTRADDTANPFEAFGEDSECAPPESAQAFCGPRSVSATADLSHVVLESSVALSSPAGANLYEFSAGEPAGEALAPVTILPEGAGPTDGDLGLADHDMRNAISADGSRVFWSTGTEGGALYVRDVVKGETLLIAGGAEFQAASSDGSRVFYTEGGGLFECAISEVAGKLKCTTTGLGAGVLSTIAGVSEDGSWVYFVASSVLAEGGVGGSPNLYVRHAGVTRLVAVLSPADAPDWAGRPGESGHLPFLAARVSPDGRWLAFMSERGLTGYDTRDAVSGARDEELYLYHAPESLGTEPASLVCASCDPSGARPVGEEAERVSLLSHGAGIVGGDAWAGSSTWLAANVPGWQPYAAFTSVYQPRYLSDGGRLFFDARDPLVSLASGGSWDVYEYEPVGVGPEGAACGPLVDSGSEVFKPGGSVVVEGREVVEGAGCVGLVSGGASGQESAFLDASEDGSEVFFMTAARLSPLDTDDAYDVYDAHECTGGSPCFPAGAVVPPGCVTEASCRPAPTPQPGVYGAPASATFSGAGDFGPQPPVVLKPLTRAQKLAAALKVCRKKRDAKKRAACERAARKRYGPKAKSGSRGKGR
jgi:DNA-binding beta-propeller fold protein YncE